jgi:hypothetical protein
MLTRRTARHVPLAVAAAATLALGACARGPAVAGAPAPTLADAPAFIRFDNDAREHVHVYLVGEQREWLLGRVAPGARTTLRLPAASLTAPPGPMRLAVLTGQHPTLEAARRARPSVANVTIAQPIGTLLAQRWTYSQGQLAPQSTPVRARRP